MGDLVRGIIGLVDNALLVVEGLEESYWSMRSHTKRNCVLCRQMSQYFKEVKGELELLLDLKTPMPESWETELGELNCYFQDANNTTLKKLSVGSLLRSKIGAFRDASKSRRQLDELMNDFEKLESRSWLHGTARRIAKNRDPDVPSISQNGEFAEKCHASDSSFCSRYTYDDWRRSESTVVGSVRAVTYLHQANDEHIPFLSHFREIAPKGGMRTRLGRVSRDAVYLESQRRGKVKAKTERGIVIFKRKDGQLVATERGIVKRMVYRVYNFFRDVKIMGTSLGGDPVHIYSTDRASYWFNNLMSSGEDVPAAAKLLSMVLEGSVKACKVSANANCCYMDLIEQKSDGIVVNSRVCPKIVQRLVFLTDGTDLFMKVWHTDNYAIITRTGPGVIHCRNSKRGDSKGLKQCMINSGVALGS